MEHRATGNDFLFYKNQRNETTRLAINMSKCKDNIRIDLKTRFVTEEDIRYRLHGKSNKLPLAVLYVSIEVLLPIIQSCCLEVKYIPTIFSHSL